MEIVYIVIDRQYLRQEGIIRACRFGRYFTSVDDVLNYFRAVDDDKDLIVITAPKYEYFRIKERGEKCI